jgi:polyhydroxybutyrate depolymerase
MPRSLLLSTLVALGLFASVVAVPACSSDTVTTAPAPPAAAPDDAMSTSGGDPAPAPSTSSTTPAPPVDAPWTPPVVATKSAACGTPQADAIHMDYTTPKGRTFHVWGPSGYDPNKTYPVVLTYHGIETNGPDFESWFQMESYTNNEAFVVYPDSAGPYWDISGTKDLEFFDEIVKQLGETYCINPSRILALGFSYGGHFVDHLGCNRAGYVKAITVGDGGPGGNDTKHCGRLPVLVTTRTNDTNELPSYGRSVVTEWTGLDKCGAPGAKIPQMSNDGTDMGYCQVQTPCSAPAGSLTYCEDTSSFGPMDPPDWNHTVREYYRAYAYNWFKALP